MGAYSSGRWYCNFELARAIFGVHTRRGMDGTRCVSHDDGLNERKDMMLAREVVSY
jgi:hypothetical protein